ncbi:hypothetical protein GCM10027592_26150 [Spirosoma flavus]
MIDILQRTASRSFPEAEFIPITTFDEAASYFYNLEGKGPRVILLDITLAGSRNGLDFSQLLKGHPIGKLVPTIVLSQSD